MSDVKIYHELPPDFNQAVSIATAWINCKGTYLFLQRNQTSKEALLWGPPGGKIEPNETPIQAVARKVFEETEIALEKPVLIDLGHFYIRKPEIDYTYHMFLYHFDEEPPLALSPEHIDFKWVNLNETSGTPLILGCKETIEEFKRRKASRNKNAT